MKSIMLKTLSLSAMLICSSLLATSQTSERVLINTGEMNIEGVMFVKGCVEMRSEVEDAVVVELEGGLHLIGSFYHDAVGNVFRIDETSWYPLTATRASGATTNRGTIHFVDVDGATALGSRSITRHTGTFDRVRNYIAFPNIEIATNDSIIVPPTMGIDANSIVRADGSTGRIFLQSGLVGTTEIYNASLRVTGNQTAAGYDFTVTPGAIVVEMRVREFRNMDGEVGGVVPFFADPMLVPFATPFTDMTASYFAGNMMHNPQFFNQPTVNSFLFPYGNHQQTDGFIRNDNLVTHVNDQLIGGRGYLLRLLPSNVDDYAGFLEWPLMHTAGQDHHRDAFIFDGNRGFENIPGGAGQVYTLFTGNSLVNHTILPNLQRTQNFVAGNSFTSALCGEKLGRVFYMLNSGREDIAELWILHHGATSYTVYRDFNEINNIQGMGVFMIVSGRNLSDIVTLTGYIDHRLQIHTDGISATPNQNNNNNTLAQRARARNFGDRLQITMTPAENPFIWSRTEVRLSDDATVSNINASINEGSGLFQITGINNSTTRLQRNVLPTSADKAQLHVAPFSAPIMMTIRVEGADELNTQVVELFDRQTNRWHDLRADNTFTYQMSPGDPVDRFEIHFVPPVPTNLPEDNRIVNWSAFNNRDELTIIDLAASYLGATARIYTATGVLVTAQTITDIPVQSINISSLPHGVYLLSLNGSVVKFVK